MGIRNQLTGMRNTDYGHTLDATTRDRELRSLQAIPDNYPKYILTMDRTVYDDFAGIQIVNILDFLLE